MTALTQSGHLSLLNEGLPNSYDVLLTRGDNETARIHIASWRGRNRVAVDGTRTADDASDWISQRWDI